MGTRGPISANDSEFRFEAMSTDYYRRMWLALVLGGTLVVAWFVVWSCFGSTNNPAGFLLVLGCLLFIAGCSYFARSRGYPGWFGFAGLAIIFGLMVLWSLPENEEPT
jgi:hypothetical protein